MKRAHDWEHINQEERHYFGDPDKPYAVDVYQCRDCRKHTECRTTRDPAPGRCPGRPHE